MMNGENPETFMKTKISGLFIGLVFLAGVHSTLAQLPVITSFSQNGLLICSNLQSGTVASVEWASSLAGPWQTNWAGLDAVTVGTNGTISVSVPMFYRVRGVAATPAGMALIPAGSFVMGNYLFDNSATNDPDITDANPTNVYVSAFYMDVNLVSYSQWQGVYNWATNHGYNFDNAGSGKAANHPVHTINWYDHVKWCNARSEMEGKVPAYYTSAAQTTVYRTGQVDMDNDSVQWSSGYRLPTEAEWEKAARGGASGQRFPWGNTISWSQANYKADPASYAYDVNYTNGLDPAFATGNNPHTSPVGYFAPNGYGLYDMAGNSSECCWDWYAAPPYPTGSPYLGGTNPTGAATGKSRVSRGGRWNGDASGARCAFRSTGYPTTANWNGGFRCVMGL